MTESEVKVPDLVSPERTQLLLPKLTDEQLATLKSYGVTEQTSVGQVLATAGDLTYDLMVVLEGQVECSDIHDGRRRALLLHGPRDFIAELDLLTGQRLYATFVVTRAGSIMLVPRTEVNSNRISVVADKAAARGANPPMTDPSGSAACWRQAGTPSSGCLPARSANATVARAARARATVPPSRCPAYSRPVPGTVPLFVRGGHWAVSTRGSGPGVKPVPAWGGADLTWRGEVRVDACGPGRLSTAGAGRQPDRRWCGCRAAGCGFGAAR
jgi:CRP-like cAMP-binding protein